MTKLIFQAIDWFASDTENGESYVITIFGRTPEGESVAISTPFNPYFFVDMRVKKKPNSYDRKAYYQKVMKDCNGYSSGNSMYKQKCVRGFQNNREKWFMKLDFDTLTKRGFARYALENKDYSLYEADVDPLLRFMHRSGVKSTGWIEIDERVCSHTADFRSDIQYHVTEWRDIKSIEREEVAPFVIASFDIETFSHDGTFPDPTVPENVIFQIGVTTQIYGMDDYSERICLCLKETEGVDFVSYNSEADLLNGFADLVERLDIDILCGWNIYGFDLRYIFERCILTNCSRGLSLSKINAYECKIKTKKLNSAALGDNELKMLPMPGTFTFDLMKSVQAEKKLESYSLNFVAKTYIGDQKIDMSPREMFDRYEEGDSKKLGEVADYCLKDTELPLKIMKRLKTIPNLLEMASASWVPINFLTERGQQIKVFSLLAMTARQSGFLIPTKRKTKKDDQPQQKYKGATVLEAQSGAYYSPITALDFASLYPSIMVAHNLCYSTLVLESKYDNLPGVEYEEFHVGRQTYRFAQNVPSLLPKMLINLKEFRKQAKKDMARTKGTPLEAVYDGKQLAYKISMNSIYGFCGATRGMFPCMPIASSVTYQGRKMIDMTKKYVEENFPGSFVRYGDTDSVMIEFNVGDKEGLEAIETSWEMGTRAAEECTKLFKKPNDLELEKVYCPFFLYTKKRYAAKMWTEQEGKVQFDCVDIKGLQMKKRDLPEYSREVCKEVLDCILESSNTDKPIALARSRADDLLKGKVDPDKLRLSKSLKSNYVNGNQPHVHVTRKMRERNPGSEPRSGERVPYIVIRNGGSKVYEKAEDPAYVEEKNLRIDYRYYFDNQFMKPVGDLLSALVDTNYDIFGNMLSTKVLNRRAKEKYNSVEGIKDIRTLFSKYKEGKDKHVEGS